MTPLRSNLKVFPVLFVVRKRLARYREIEYDEARMQFDREVFSRARLARDARFDGKFFIGVMTTGIYCRPICPARTSKEKNVCYFPTAAAAAQAGFRPCLRCRPECAPGTAARAGTSNTVSRALRLIAQTGLEDGGVEALAGHLGIGSRHLRRLFLKHLGATPSAVAQTRRLHFAKKLIDETRLTMTEIALAAGFGCVRRFNAALRDTYHRTPTQIRNRRLHANAEAENQYLFHLPFRPPFDWNSMLSFLSDRATPGVEAIEAGTYRRSISLNGHHGYFEVSLAEKSSSLIVRIGLGDPCSLFFVIERIRSLFDLNADWAVIAQTLGSDPALIPYLKAHRGLRVPGCWNGFELATRTILGQQLGLAGGTTIAGKLARAFGQQFSAAKGITHLFPSPDRLADARLAAVGLPKGKAETIRLLARAVSEERIDFERVADTKVFLNRLLEIPRIGTWTAQYIAMRALGEPDAFPLGDGALQRALNIENTKELRRRVKCWRPWRAYAAMYLWVADR